MSQPNALVQESQVLLEFLPGTPGGKPGIRFRNTSIGFSLNDDGTISNSGGNMAFSLGTAALPSMTFLGRTADGFFSQASGVIGVSFSGAERLRFASASGGGCMQVLSSGTGASFYAFSAPVGTVTVGLFHDATQTMAMRSGVNGCTLHIYNTFTDTSNYERTELAWAGTNFDVKTSFLGTGVARQLRLFTSGAASLSFGSNNTIRWQVNSNGHFITAADATYDIGTAGAARPRNSYISGGYFGEVATVTYSASMTPDVSLGNMQSITANNGTAFTINAPTGAVRGCFMTITIKNTSGGALGVITWNAVFKMTAFTSPATGFNRSIEFYYDGTNWIEKTRSAADVPN
jgi:hypothetical protein